MYKSLSLLSMCFSLYVNSIYSQSSNLPLGTEDYHTLERLETMSGQFDPVLHLTQKGASHKDAMNFSLKHLSADINTQFTSVDYQYLNQIINNTGEWKGPNGDGFLPSKRPLGPFYRQQKDFLATKKSKYYFSLNPVLGYQAITEGKEQSNQEFKHNYFIGAQMAARYEDWLSADFRFVHANENPITPYRDYINEFGGMDGNVYQQHSNGQLIANQFRANVHVKLYKDYVGLSVGRDHHFIGNGYRSLMLSNFTTSYWYAKLTTKVWKFQYQNIFAKHEAQLSNQLPGISEQKYSATHHLSLNVTPWLNVGVFENIMFGRNDRYEFGYLNPVLLYRAAERSVGSPDKMIIGLNAKALVKKTANIYGQFIINEFTASEFFGNNGYWANKWGAQLGVNYYNAFTIPNLDIKLETNMVRPYTYSSTLRASNEILSNYTHANLPMAHPLGAGFVEGIFKAKYRLGNYFIIDLSSIIYKHTLDLPTENNGGNILYDYDTRSHNFGVNMVGDYHSMVWNTNLNLSYRIYANVYFDIGGTYRNSEISGINTAQQTWNIYTGLRMNLQKKDYIIF